MHVLITYKPKACLVLRNKPLIQNEFPWKFVGKPQSLTLYSLQSFSQRRVMRQLSMSTRKTVWRYLQARSPA